jgi:UDP-N-acetylmuramoylalanine--D-glutamate ligase
VLGLARQGKAAARYFAEQGAEVVVSDLQGAESLAPACDELADLPLSFVLGGHPPELLDGADLLCLSGGVPADLPLAQQAAASGIRLTNDSQILLEHCPAHTIGITGSAGKTTTTALVGRMAERYAEATGRGAWVGGNIGNPLLAALPQMKPEDWVVLELSSFQLELMTTSVEVAAVLNLTPNHLDRHHTMQAYAAAKARILNQQTEQAKAVLCADDPGSWSLRSEVRGSLICFGVADHGLDGTYLGDGNIILRREGGTQSIMPIDAIPLRGFHNRLNVLGACAIASAAGIDPRHMADAISGFEGVPHRLEFVRRVGDVDWFNDSIGTAPERSMAAIRAFDEPLVLLAGGRDKDLPWEGFADLVIVRVDHLVLFGEAAPKIEQAILQALSRNPTAHLQTLDRCGGLREAVVAAQSRARAGDVVLLSPGGTSFDEFKDFEARGEAFNAMVMSL